MVNAFLPEAVTQKAVLDAPNEQRNLSIDDLTVVTAMRHAQPEAVTLLVSGYPDWRVCVGQGDCPLSLTCPPRAPNMAPPEVAFHDRSKDLTLPRRREARRGRHGCGVQGRGHRARALCRL